jgi:hypothetical protein
MVGTILHLSLPNNQINSPGHLIFNKQSILEGNDALHPGYAMFTLKRAWVRLRFRIAADVAVLDFRGPAQFDF